MQNRVLSGVVIAAVMSGAASPATAERKSPTLTRAENVIKMIIGVNHLRCAEIVNVQKMDDTIFDVTCIKKAGVGARVHYAVDAANNAVVALN